MLFYEDLLVDKRSVANAIMSHEQRLDELLDHLKLVRVAHTKGFKLVKDADAGVIRTEGN